MASPAANMVLFPLAATGQEAIIQYNTTIITGANAREVRNANWQDGRYKYNLKFSIRSLADVRVLQAFFHVVKGRETAFLFKDLFDYQIPLNQTAYAGDGVKKTFPVVKNYTDVTGNGYTRPISKYLASSLAVYLDGGKVTGGLTKDDAGGTFTFATAPSSGQTITFKVAEFYVPIRFDSDELPANLEAYWDDPASGGFGNVALPDIPAIEVK